MYWSFTVVFVPRLLDYVVFTGSYDIRQHDKECGSPWISMDSCRGFLQQRERCTQHICQQVSIKGGVNAYRTQDFFEIKIKQGVKTMSVTSSGSRVFIGHLNRHTQHIQYKVNHNSTHTHTYIHISTQIVIFLTPTAINVTKIIRYLTFDLGVLRVIAVQ